MGVVCYKAFMQWVWFAIRLSCSGCGLLQGFHAVGVVCYKAFMQWVWFATRLSCSGVRVRI